MQADPSQEQDSPLRGHLKKFLTEERMTRISEVLQRRTRYLTLALENIYQPHNAAACIRSCDCFGIQDIHVIEDQNDFEPAETVSMGAEKWVDIHRYQDTTSCCSKLKEEGYCLASLTLQEGSIPLDHLELPQKTALLIGTELTGLSKEAHEASDVHVHLPMQGFTQSFNLSVCAALSLQILRAKLDTGKANWELSNAEKGALEMQWIKRSVRNADKLVKAYAETEV